MANTKLKTYVCPGCGQTSKRGFGWKHKCGYEIPANPSRFPSIEELIEGKNEFIGNNWQDVDLIKFTRAITDYLINSKQIKLIIKYDN